jgi:hypothetical protein
MQTDETFDGRPASFARGGKAGAHRLQITKIAGVSPLDNQLGVEPKKTVPDALREVLFGGPLATYAILDAAKGAGLPVMLADSGLAHRCLFKGEALEDLGDVGPWLVRLEETHDFTRRLFTKGDAPWQMWDKEPGIYVRSAATLDELWRHFRKFTRVQDEVGKWYYFRFWEQKFLAPALRTDGSVSNLYCRIHRGGDHVVLRDGTDWVDVSRTSLAEREQSPLVDRAEFDRIVRNSNLDKLLSNIRAKHKFLMADQDVRNALAASERYDFDEEDRRNYLSATLLMAASGVDIEDHVSVNWRESPYSDSYMARELLAHAKAMNSSDRDPI